MWMCHISLKCSEELKLRNYDLKYMKTKNCMKSMTERNFCNYRQYILLKKSSCCIAVTLIDSWRGHNRKKQKMQKFKNLCVCQLNIHYIIPIYMSMYMTYLIYLFQIILCIGNQLWDHTLKYFPPKTLENSKKLDLQFY